MHRKWRQREWNTQTVHAVGIKSAMMCSLRERAEDKGEERRGGPLNEAGVRVTVSPKEERREGKWGLV